MGYWEPHSSSITFCETDYAKTSYIVELHNTWSSLLGISLWGVIGLLYANPLNEMRCTLGYVVAILIGVGSAGLHGTLHWVFQSSDELPMIYIMLCILYMCAEHDAKIGKPHYPNLPGIMIVIAVFSTILYFRFQHIFEVFAIYFSFLSTMSTLWQLQIMRFSKDRPSKQVHDISLNTLLIYVLVAIPCWFFDMFQCDKVLSVVDEYAIFMGMTPHIIWHFGGGLTIYGTIFTLCCIRLEKLNIAYKIDFLFGIPIISKENDKNKAL